jgi:hypothetical protein
MGMVGWRAKEEKLAYGNMPHFKEKKKKKKKEDAIIVMGKKGKK